MSSVPHVLLFHLDRPGEWPVPIRNGLPSATGMHQTSPMESETLPPPAPSADAINAALARRVDECDLSPGMVLGLVDGGERKFFSRGSASQPGEPVTERTVFEIGSVTKLFTALLLADMARRGEVALDAPVAELLPTGTRVPGRDQVPITLAHLATHTSGLPRLPDDIVVGSSDPYADYTPDRLYAFLERHELSRTPGESFEYSNIGAGLLGHALGLLAGRGYEQLLKERILDPLAMTDTTVHWRPGTSALRAVGHNDRSEPVPYWTFDVLAGAGAILSTAGDLARFVAALIAESGPLTLAMATLLALRTEGGLGLGEPHADGVLGLQHEGQTRGFHSYLRCIPRWRRGAVVLANSSSGPVVDLGIHCCDPRWGLRWFRQVSAIDPVQLDKLIGIYRLRPNLLFHVTRQDARLMVQLTGQAMLQVFPSTEWEFFYKVIGAQLTFEPGPGGRAVRLILHQNSIDQIAERVA